jgi:hypothetical protein
MVVCCWGGIQSEIFDFVLVDIKGLSSGIGYLTPALEERAEVS